MRSAINPFLLSSTPPAAPAPRPTQPRQAKLPRAPVTASPVPGLTSLYHDDDPGPWGDRAYPGNCGGNIIRDLLLYFRPGSVFDPFVGSGTCRQVCASLGIPFTGFDIRHGLDACSPASYPRAKRFDFVWSHPPYFRQKLYTNDPRDLSRQPGLEAFLGRYALFIEGCAGVLAPGGKFAVLMGDYCDRELGLLPLVYHTKRLAFGAGLRQHCTDIIRFGHGASSGRKSYRSSFIPGLHDVVSIFERAGE